MNTEPIACSYCNNKACWKINFKKGHFHVCVDCFSSLFMECLDVQSEDVNFKEAHARWTILEEQKKKKKNNKN